MFFEKEIVNYPSADDVVVPSGNIIWPESTGFLKPRMQRYRIVVVGAGYAGLSIAILLAGSNDVTIVDITPEKVDALNRCVSPIQDEFIIKYMNEAKSGKCMLHFRATLNAKSAYAEADFVVVAVPTNYAVKTWCIISMSGRFATKVPKTIGFRNFFALWRKIIRVRIWAKPLDSYPDPYAENSVRNRMG